MKLQTVRHRFQYGETIDFALLLLPLQWIYKDIDEILNQHMKSDHIYCQTFITSSNENPVSKSYRWQAHNQLAIKTTTTTTTRTTCTNA